MTPGVTGDESKKRRQPDPAPQGGGQSEPQRRRSAESVSQQNDHAERLSQVQANAQAEAEKLAAAGLLAGQARPQALEPRQRDGGIPPLMGSPAEGR